MKITKELLQNYSKGQCTEVEKIEIELWLLTQDYNIKISEEDFGNSIQNIKQKLHTELFELQPKPKVFPLYKKIMRYVAVACLLISVYVVGKYSATDNASVLLQQTAIEEPNNLLVYGGNGTYGKISGTAFSLQFDGQLKLYNESKRVKTVNISKKTLTLQPMQSYILIGDNQEYTIFSGLSFEREQFAQAMLRGDFGIRVLKV